MKNSFIFTEDDKFKPITPTEGMIAIQKLLKEENNENLY